MIMRRRRRRAAWLWWCAGAIVGTWQRLGPLRWRRRRFAQSLLRAATDLEDIDPTWSVVARQVRVLARDVVDRRAA